MGLDLFCPCDLSSEMYHGDVSTERYDVSALYERWGNRGRESVCRCVDGKMEGDVISFKCHELLDHASGTHLLGPM